MLVLIRVKTGLYLRPQANMVDDFLVKISFHDIFLTIASICACPTMWGIEDLHQTAAVEEELCPSGVGCKTPGE